MKKVFIALCCIIVVVVGGVSWAMYPKFSNMKSEYSTAGAIDDLSSFVKTHRCWPSSSKELYPEGDPNTGVFIDYTVSIEELRNDPAILRKCIRPQSGKFYTYPHYERNLEQLNKQLELKSL